MVISGYDINVLYLLIVYIYLEIVESVICYDYLGYS